jgi:hypothetical protein
VSLIFWTLTLIVLVKYVGIIIRFDDNGEGERDPAVDYSQHLCPCLNLQTSLSNCLCTRHCNCFLQCSLCPLPHWQPVLHMWLGLSE